MTKFLYWVNDIFKVSIINSGGGVIIDPNDPMLDFSKADNSQYIVLLEDI
jgi:hypothetical protein